MVYMNKRYIKQAVESDSDKPGIDNTSNAFVIRSRVIN